MTEIEMDEIDITREKAKEFVRTGNTIKAEEILEQLWTKSSKNDVYLLYEYGNVLRSNNKQIVFINICRECYNNKSIINNTYIKNLLCWCIYEVYIKDFVKDEDSDFNEFIKEANFIKDNIVQLPKEQEHYNPYVLTIFKVIRVYMKSASINYKEILKWLNFLEPNELPEEVFKFQDSKGKERERASKKEFFYQYKTKALEKLQKYEECINICEEALKSIEKFHYRNDVWIKARLYFSKCMEANDNNLECEIREYKNLALEENHWFMYHKISSMYGDMEKWKNPCYMQIKH